MKEGLIIAVDLGGTRLRVALMDREGNVLKRITRATGAAEGREAVLARLYDALAEAKSAAASNRVLGMGLAIAGPLDSKAGKLLRPPNLPLLADLPLKALVGQRFGLPVRMENDATLAALGEHRFGAGRGVDHLVFITVSTGIGGGVISGGRLLTGARGMAAEVGHMILEREGPPCNCGRRGCLEALASGWAVARMAREKIAQGVPTLLASGDFLDEGEVTARSVAGAARAGDAAALEIMERARRALTVAIVNLLHLFNPERIVIGGGLSNAWGLMMAPLEKEVAALAMPGYAEGLRIVPSALGDDAGLMGAAALFLE